jgi:hypothetical protein
MQRDDPATDVPAPETVWALRASLEPDDYVALVLRQSLGPESIVVGILRWYDALGLLVATEPPTPEAPLICRYLPWGQVMGGAVVRGATVDVAARALAPFVKAVEEHAQRRKTHAR